MALRAPRSRKSGTHFKGDELLHEKLRRAADPSLQKERGIPSGLHPDIELSHQIVIESRYQEYEI